MREKKNSDNLSGLPEFRIVPALFVGCAKWPGGTVYAQCVRLISQVPGALPVFHGTE